MPKEEINISTEQLINDLLFKHGVRIEKTDPTLVLLTIFAEIFNKESVLHDQILEEHKEILANHNEATMQIIGSETEKINTVVDDFSANFKAIIESASLEASLKIYDKVTEKMQRHSSFLLIYTVIQAVFLLLFLLGVFLWKS